MQSWIGSNRRARSRKVKDGDVKTGNPVVKIGTAK
jgi:hypothetical protein